jgi:hypothetical protein
MVLAISFLEAPLKFRAPDVTLRVGLGIGRLVFRARNTAEALFAAVLAGTLVVADVPGRVVASVARRDRRAGAAARRDPARAQPPFGPGARGGEPAPVHGAPR